MSKLEKRLIIFAIIFVVVYMGAIVITIKSRIAVEDQITRIESPLPSEEEGRLLLVELLPAMAVLFALAVCFLIAKKQREKKYKTLDETDEENILNSP